MTKKSSEKTKKNGWAVRLCRAQVYFKPEQYEAAALAAARCKLSLSSWLVGVALIAARGGIRVEDVKSFVTRSGIGARPGRPPKKKVA